MENEKQYEKDFKDFINLLNKHKVNYLIVGAYAVIYHTNISRFTKDIDFWICPTPENAQKCAAAVKEFCSMDVKKEALLEPGAIHYIGEAPFRLDIFNSQGNLDFEEAWKKKETGKFRDISVYYISREDLIALKQHFNREHDRKDLKRLNRKKS
ncbi:MAG: nucleotidyltransferase [Elusimicrobia bacterium]|nr:nucleotidyltransferase [Elusimicrobiota bacterium]